MDVPRDLLGDVAPEGGGHSGPPRGNRYKPAKGHAAPKGSGPDGMTCGDCKHIRRTNSARHCFFKCFLMFKHWTHGRGSDILKRDRACRYFEPVESKNEDPVHTASGNT